MPKVARTQMRSASTGSDLILGRLRWGPATVEELAEEAGLTPNGVRAQLAVLERDGWVVRAGVRRGSGAGKPATIYQLADQAESRFSQAHLPLLLGLVRALEERETATTRAAIYRGVGRSLAAEQGAVAGDFEAKVAAAVATLEGIGAQLKITRDRKRITVTGAGCPVGEAVSIDPCVCETNATLISVMVGVPVIDRCIRDGRPRCRFEIPLS